MFLFSFFGLWPSLHLFMYVCMCVSLPGFFPCGMSVCVKSFMTVSAFVCVTQLGKMRLMIPCRALTCSHLQCFDATLYIQMNEKKPTWVCPVCDKKAPYEHLIIDGYAEQWQNRTAQRNVFVCEIVFTILTLSDLYIYIFLPFPTHFFCSSLGCLWRFWTVV